jgi:hypothetical protein
MIQFNRFNYNPGGEDGGGVAPNKDEQKKEDSSILPKKADEGEEDKTVVEKIKEALQDWSEKDEEDQEFDDTQV